MVRPVQLPSNGCWIAAGRYTIWDIRHSLSREVAQARRTESGPRLRMPLGHRGHDRGPDYSEVRE